LREYKWIFDSNTTPIGVTPIASWLHSKISDSHPLRVTLSQRVSPDRLAETPIFKNFESWGRIIPASTY
jgi:hypothetical protein